MKLAVFGATGTTGSALVGQALAAGHELRVLARTPSKVSCTDQRLVLRCLDDPATIGTAPMIANGQSAFGVLRTLHDIVRPPRG
jgi:nucleoside-diphosphate-sugar epimerase